MAEKYLLPCRCGQNSVVEPRQAGEMVVCRCGLSVQVPTMREIMALEPAPAEPLGPRSQKAWGWPQAMMLLGCGFIVVAVVLAGVFWAFVPPIPPSEMMTAEIAQKVAESLTPAKTLEFWEYFKQGLDRRTSPSYNGGSGSITWAKASAWSWPSAGQPWLPPALRRGERKKRGGEGETGRWGNLVTVKQ